MNIKAFKRLIKEAVTEAIYEELPDILNEAMARQNKTALRENQQTLNFTSNDIQTSNPVNPALRSQLVSKMGSMFGHNIPSTNTLPTLNTDNSDQPLDLSAFIADSAMNMTAQERAGLSRLD